MSIEDLNALSEWWNKIEISKFILDDKSIERKNHNYKKVLDEYKSFFFFWIEEDTFLDIQKEEIRWDEEWVWYTKLSIKIVIKTDKLQRWKLTQDQKDKLYFLVNLFKKEWYQLSNFWIWLNELDWINDTVDCGMWVCWIKKWLFKSVEELLKKIWDSKITRKELEENFFNIFYNGLDYSISKLGAYSKDTKVKVLSLVTWDLETYKQLLIKHRKDFLKMFEDLRAIEDDNEFKEKLENYLVVFSKNIEISWNMFAFKKVLLWILEKWKGSNFSKEVLDKRLNWNKDIYYYTEKFWIKDWSQLKNWAYIFDIFYKSVVLIWNWAYIRVGYKSGWSRYSNVYISLDSELDWLLDSNWTLIGYVELDSEVIIWNTTYIKVSSVSWGLPFMISKESLEPLLTNRWKRISKFYDDSYTLDFKWVKYRWIECHDKSWYMSLD